MRKKRTAGRPSGYDPAICKKMIAFFETENRQAYFRGARKKKGGEVSPYPWPTFEKFAAANGLNTMRLYRWATVRNKSGELIHADFAAAYERAKQLHVQWLTEYAQEGKFLRPRKTPLPTTEQQLRSIRNLVTKKIRADRAACVE